MTAERLRQAVARLRNAAANATPGPWSYDSYSGIFASDLGYDAWREERFEEGHTLERSACPNCPGKPICQHYYEEYRRRPLVGGVPAAYGDTAIGNHQADAMTIAVMHPGVALAVADWLEAEVKLVVSRARDANRIMPEVKFSEREMYLNPRAIAVAEAVLGQV